MRRCTLKCHSCNPGLKLNVWIGIRISRLQPLSFLARGSLPDAVPFHVFAIAAGVDQAVVSRAPRIDGEHVARPAIKERAQNEANVILGLHRCVTRDAEADNPVRIVFADDAEDDHVSTGEHLHGGAKSRRHPFARLGLRKRVDQFGACPRRLTQCSVDGDGLGAAAGAQYWRGWFLAEGKRRRQDPDDDDEIRKMPFQTGTRDCYGSVAVRRPRGPRVPKPPSLHVRLGAPPGRPCVSIHPQQYPGARAMQSAGSL